MIGRPLSPVSVAGVRRRGRRRGLIAGAAIGAGVAHHNAKNNAQQEHEAPQQPVQQGISQDDKLEQLEKLANLKQQGILTDAEFEQQKASILNG